MTAGEDEVFRISQVDPSALASERDRTIAFLSQFVPADWISEVGSTALEGVVGKQDIDILVLVPASSFDTVRSSLDLVLRRNPEQLSTHQYQGYRFDSPLDIAVQLTVKGGPHDHFHRFLEALKESPPLMAAYNQLKAHWHGKPMSGYREAKAAFIQSVLDRT